MSPRRRKTLTRQRFLLVVIFDMIDSRWTFVFFTFPTGHRHLSIVGKFRLPFNPVCRFPRPLRQADRGETDRPPIWRRARRRLAGRGRSGARNGGRARRGEPVKAHHRRGNEAAKTPSTFPTSVCIALGKSEFKYLPSLVFQPRSAYLAEIELGEREQWS